MKLDNFTTARCRKCGWIKQFQPGKEYSNDDISCDCVEEVEEKSLLDQLKDKADELGISYAKNIGEASLAKKIKEAQDGNES